MCTIGDIGFIMNRLKTHVTKVSRQCQLSTVWMASKLCSYPRFKDMAAEAPFFFLILDDTKIFGCFFPWYFLTKLQLNWDAGYILQPAASIHALRSRAGCVCTLVRRREWRHGWWWSSCNLLFAALGYWFWWFEMVASHRVEWKVIASCAMCTVYGSVPLIRLWCLPM